MGLSRKNKDIDCYALFVNGYALDYSSKHDDAIKCFDRVIDYYDNEACDDEAVVASLIGKGIALNYNGMKHKDKDRYDEAEKCFDRAIEICNE